MQDNESIIRRFFCIPFTENIISEKALLDYTNLFSPMTTKRITKGYMCFKDKYGRRSKSRVSIKKNL